MTIRTLTNILSQSGSCAKDESLYRLSIWRSEAERYFYRDLCRWAAENFLMGQGFSLFELCHVCSLPVRMASAREEAFRLQRNATLPKLIFTKVFQVNNRSGAMYMVLGHTSATAGASEYLQAYGWNGTKPEKLNYSPLTKISTRICWSRSAQAKSISAMMSNVRRSHFLWSYQLDER